MTGFQPVSQSSPPPTPLEVPPLGTPTSPSQSYVAARRSSRWKSLLLGTALGLVAAGALLFFAKPGVEPPLALQPLPPCRVVELQSVEATARLSNGARQAGVQFLLVSGPHGATVNPSSGRFYWLPGEEDGPGVYEVVIGARTPGSDVTPETRFTITVDERNQPPTIEAIGEKTVDVGQTLSFVVTGHDPDIPARELRYSLLPGAARRRARSAKRPL